MSALGLVGGVIGFFRSIAAGHRAASAATQAADARADAVAALRASAQAEQRIAASGPGV